MQIPHGHELTPNAIARLTEMEIWLQSFFAPWIGEIIMDKKRYAQTGASVKPIPTDSPITRYKGHKEEGTDTVLVPMIRRLTGDPVLGDLVAEGNEESSVVYDLPVYVNAINKPLETCIGPMDELRAKRLAQAKFAQPLLRAYFSDLFTWYLTQAYYKRFSPNITDAAVDGGLGITSSDHPNMLVADDGLMTWNATPATYSETIQTALQALEAKGANADTVMSAQLLDAIREQIIIPGQFPPAGYLNGKPFHVLVTNAHTQRQAREDSIIAGATKEAFSGKETQSPLLNGATLYYGGIALVENVLLAPEIHDDAAGNILYGPVNSAEDTLLNPLKYTQSTDVADRDMKCSLLIGGGSMAIGQATGLKLRFYDTDQVDHEGEGRKENMAAEIIWGAARGDFNDNVGTKTAVLNQSSAVIVTYSPPV